MKSNAVASARQTLAYVQVLERENRRLRREMKDRDGIIAGLRDAAAGRVKPLAQIDREQGREA